jgi:hypothetical protein
MIKSISEITLFDIDKMERTGEISQFKRWYNILPAMFFIEKIKSVVSNFITEINNGRSDETDELIALDDIEYYARLKIEVNELRALDMLFVLLLGNQPILLNIKSMIKTRRLRKIIPKTEELKFACEKAKELTGIEIINLDDVKKFREWAKYKKEKLYSYESGKIKEATDTLKDGKVYTIRYAIRVMNFLKQSIDVEKMKCSTFICYNTEAISKVAQLKNAQKTDEE